jgi:hypothetical protein
MIHTDTIPIRMELACDFDDCTKFAYPLYKQLRDGNYGQCSVMQIPTSLQTWRQGHRTARKRADRCRRRGYRFTLVRPDERSHDIYEINTSMPERQGRPMSAGYLSRDPVGADPVFPCLRHTVRRYGVELGAELVAYLWIYRAGELALVSQILGHGRHLENEIMYLLWEGMVELESAEPDGYIVYNRHDSGTDGLRFYKERVGLEEQSVRWEP